MYVKDKDKERVKSETGVQLHFYVFLGKRILTGIGPRRRGSYTNTNTNTNTNTTQTQTQTQTTTKTNKHKHKQSETS